MDVRAMYEAIEHIFSEENMEITLSMYDKKGEFPNTIEGIDPVTQKKCRVTIKVEEKS